MSCSMCHVESSSCKSSLNVYIDKVVESAEQIRDEARLGHRSPEDIEEVSNTLIELCQSYVDANVALTPAEEIHTSNIADPLVCAGKGEKLDTNPVVIPASVKKLLESQPCKERLQRNAQRYVFLFCYLLHQMQLNVQ
jgi:hypothetical protein